MAVRIEQTAEAEAIEFNARGICTESQIMYQVFGADNEAQAARAVVNYVPQRYQGLYFDRVRITDRLGNEGLCRVAAIYRIDEPGVGTGGRIYDEEPVRRVTIGSMTVRRDYAASRVWLSPGAPVILATNLGINMNRELRPGGVDVNVGTLNEQMTVYKSRSTLTASFKKRLKSMVGGVNAEPFADYAAGEMRFDGVAYEYRKSQSQKVAITYFFTIQNNTDRFQFGDYVVYKNGWDYAHFFYTKVNVDGALRDIPQAAMIDRVLPYFKFSELGIPRSEL